MRRGVVVSVVVLAVAWCAAPRAAVAGNAAGFVDPAADARRAPDVTAVDVANDDAGVLTFRVAMPREPSGAGTLVRILLDTDRNGSTGEGGAEWAVTVTDGRTVVVEEWWVAGWLRRVQRTPPSVSWSQGPAVSIDRAGVGAPGGFGFRVETVRTAGATGDRDRAPDAGHWSYDVVVPDTDGDRFPDPVDNCPELPNRQFDTDGDGAGNECDAAPFPIDVEAPLVEALPSTITRGRVAYLQYRVHEDGRATSERVRVIVGRRTTALLRTPLGHVDDGVAYSTLWRVPAGIRRATFCVNAEDAAGNVAPESCAPVSTTPAPAAPPAGAPPGTLVVAGRPTFVLALSNGPPALGAKAPDGADALTTVARAGINLLRVGPAGAVWTEADIGRVAQWNAAAAEAGARTWVALHDLALAAPGSPEAALLGRVVGRLRDDAGLGLWRGVDEPYWTRWPASALGHAHETVRALDPAHPLLTVQAPRGTRWDLAPYAAVTSAHGINSYPVSFSAPDPDLHRVGRWTAMLRSATPSNAVVTTLQVCSSGSYDPWRTGAFAQPTRREERYMAYDAIINGARGLVFYGSRNPRCLVDADRPHEWNWKFWRTVLRPLLTELRAGTTLHRALLTPPSPLRLRVDDAATQVAVRAVGRDELWVLAARHGRRTRRVEITGLPEWAAKATVYAEGRTVRARAGVLTDRFSRWGVHVYRFVR